MSPGRRSASGALIGAEVALGPERQPTASAPHRGSVRQESFAYVPLCSLLPLPSASFSSQKQQVQLRPAAAWATCGLPVAAPFKLSSGSTHAVKMRSRNLSWVATDDNVDFGGTYRVAYPYGLQCCQARICKRGATSSVSG